MSTIGWGCAQIRFVGYYLSHPVASLGHFEQSATKNISHNIMQNKNKKLKINYMLNISKEKFQNTHVTTQEIIKKKLKNFIFKINFLL